ncbi:hypothetical protein [Ensifer sp. SL37]|uniref:hypothetical protein n=1 Tax=Ensifer sp. SL37 TaxID=2995137 RepID=UPI002272CAC7|nr:hypothetical protein [Ensifer sp. SL37]MCY1740491.1 hypothetical protein [Ensifer sp. SL37]
MRPQVERQVVALSGPGPRFVLFFSISDGRARAEVSTATGQDFAGAWRRGARDVYRSALAKKIAVRWLRVDWVEAVEKTTWADLRLRLVATKRNYFRYGISLDPSFSRAFLEMELNANAMLYEGGATSHAVLNTANFRRYAKTRHGLLKVGFEAEGDVFVFSTRGAFATGSDQDVHLIHGVGPNAGRRVLSQLKPVDVRLLIKSASTYLSTQVLPDGRFQYGWHPCFDRPIPTYNVLRHTSTLYSMIEAWEVTQCSDLKAAIDRALEYLTTVIIKTVDANGVAVSVLVDQDADIKLGASGVCLLALVKYSELTGTKRYIDLLRQVAEGIVYMQDPSSGKLRHIYNYPSLSLREEFRTIYYDGEAAFGLMRLYGFTGEERWLEPVRKAFTCFLAGDHWKAHDHWLSYCVNELTLHCAEAKYFEFGLKNFVGHLDFVLNRITTFPTLLELMMAAEKMVTRLRLLPEFAHLMEAVDLEKFYAALDHRAHYLLNGYFWPEVAMYFANPAKIQGSFFIRHHSFRVRIDDVEHYLSGYVAYLDYLERSSGQQSSQGDLRMSETAV